MSAYDDGQRITEILLWEFWGQDIGDWDISLLRSKEENKRLVFKMKLPTPISADTFTKFMDCIEKAVPPPLPGYREAEEKEWPALLTWIQVEGVDTNANLVESGQYNPVGYVPEVPVFPKVWESGSERIMRTVKEKLNKGLCADEEVQS